MTALDHSYVDSNGVRLHVATAGDPSNPPIVLIHGWPDSLRCWDAIIPYLLPRLHVIAYDQRGFGWSGMPKGTDQYRLEVAVADLAAVMAHVGVERAAAVGHDLGGAVIWNAAAFAPEMLTRAVVASAPHPMRLRAVAASNPDQLRRSFYAWLLHTGAAGEELLAAQGFVPFARWLFAGARITPEIVDERIATWSQPGRFSAMAEWYRAGFRPELFNPDIPLELPAAQIPIRYLQGEHDVAFVPEAGHGSGAFVEAEYEESIIAGATHWLPYDAPRVLADVIVDWTLRSPAA